MRGNIHIILAILVSTAGGCALRSEVPESSTKKEEQGNLVAFWLEYTEDGPGTRAINVTERYAVLMVWYGKETRFFTYDNVEKRIYKTRAFTTFLTHLATLPKNIQIQRFDTCTVSRVYDMPEKATKEVDRVLAAGNRSWARSSKNGLQMEMICSCESSRFRYP